MKVVKNFTAIISKEEREKVTSVMIDVLDNLLSNINLDVTSKEKYEILYSIAFQDEDVYVNNTTIFLKYEH